MKLKASDISMKVRMFLAMLVLPISAIAASAQDAQPQRIVTVTFNAAVLQTKEAQRAFADLQAKFASREAGVKSLNGEVDTLKKQMTAVGETLSDTERAARLKTIDEKERELQREAEDLKSDSTNESQQAFQTVAQKVYAFLQEYSQQHRYTFVLERGSNENPVVWYSANSDDITASLVQAYDARTGSLPHRTGAASPSPR